MQISSLTKKKKKNPGFSIFFSICAYVQTASICSPCTMSHYFCFWNLWTEGLGDNNITAGIPLYTKMYKHLLLSFVRHTYTPTTRSSTAYSFSKYKIKYLFAIIFFMDFCKMFSFLHFHSQCLIERHKCL